MMKMGNRNRSPLVRRPMAAAMRGVTMVELLIAMVIGLGLTAGVVQVYVGNNQTERHQQAHQLMQENGRFAMHFLAREVRMAGYMGCLSEIDEDDINNTLDGSPPSFRPDAGIEGWESDHGSGTALGEAYASQDDLAVESTSSGNWSTSDSATLETFEALPGSDLVRVWNMAGGTAASILDISPGANTNIESTITDISDGDILLISDCENADWVQACNVQELGGGATIQSTLSAGCNPGNDTSLPVNTTAGGQLVKLQGTMFYIGKRGGDASNPPALFRRQLSNQATLGPAEELVEGIESMQILYGVNDDNDNQKSADMYVPADQVPDWERVVSARISVLVQSLEDNLVDAPQSYSFNGVTYDGSAGNGALPDDNRLRRVFTTTVTLRNRTVGQ